MNDLHLSPRQALVLAAAADGVPLSVVAARLGTTRTQVASRLSEAYRALDVLWLPRGGRRAEAVRVARAAGLIPIVAKREAAGLCARVSGRDGDSGVPVARGGERPSGARSEPLVGDAAPTVPGAVAPSRGHSGPLSAPQRPDGARDREARERGAESRTEPPPTVICQWCRNPIPRRAATRWDDKAQCQNPFACTRKASRQ